MRGECAESTRILRAFSAYSPRILRVFSAHSPRIFRTRGECAENTRRMRVSPRDFPQAQEMTYYKPFSFLMGISMGKLPDFEYRVGKWLKYDRSGYNSSHLILAILTILAILAGHNNDQKYGQ